MIHIHKQLWVIKNPDRDVEGASALLSYMTHREYDKNGLELEKFKKRKATGTSWASPSRYRQPPTPAKTRESLDFDNAAIKGFKVVGSTTRWSTSNRLIYIEDPRGFVVEIPVSNLTTLLKHVTVKSGEVLDECVWGREGNNHILLPINSEVYKKAFDQTQLNSEKISFSKLVVGQVVKFSVDNLIEYVYLGRGKAAWKFTEKESQGRHQGYHRSWIRLDSDRVLSTLLQEDPSLAFIFKRVGEHPWIGKWEYKTSGKCIVVGKTTELPSIEDFTNLYPPERVSNKVEGYSRDDWSRGSQNYFTHEFHSIKMKEPK